MRGLPVVSDKHVGEQQGNVGESLLTWERSGGLASRSRGLLLVLGTMESSWEGGVPWMPALLAPSWTPTSQSAHTQPRSPQTSICSPILQPPVKFHQLSTLQKGGVLLVRHSFHGGGHLACSPSSFVLLHDRPPFPYRGLSRVLKKHFRSGQHHCPNSI